jgi:hypothetical protein
MKKTVSLILLLVLTTNCSSYKVNVAFGLMGIYNDEVKISKLTNDTKEILFIPMHHIGTKLFYVDVNKKVDSLENLGFYFYTEKVTGSKEDTIALLKVRKLTGIPFSKKKSGYLAMYDSMYDGKIKYKKELIDQPAYKDMGVDSLISKNVDVTIKDMVRYYETKYGEIKLEKCDYETVIDKKSLCKAKPIDRKQSNDAILNFRNKHILEELQKDPHQKIAIIYGAKHFTGIKEELLKLGYK